jgi:hypothetical protein
MKKFNQESGKYLPIKRMEFLVVETSQPIPVKIF